MSDELQTPDNTLVLRNLQGMRRDMQEMIERQARAIELVGHVGELSMRLDEVSTCMDKGFNGVRSSLLRMENRVLTAQSDVLAVVRRLGEGPEPLDDGRTSR